MSTNTELEAALVELTGALEQLTKAQVQVADARRNETFAINRLNAAQKQFDKLVDGIKKDAPRDTDWARLRMPKHEAMSA